MIETIASGTSKPRAAEVQAVVIRADGTREDLGVIAYWHRNPLKRLWFFIRKNLLGRIVNHA